MLIFPFLIILNLLTKLSLRIVLLVTLHFVYNNYVILFFIYVFLLTEIVFHAGVEGQLTYL